MIPTEIRELITKTASHLPLVTWGTHNFDCFKWGPDGLMPAGDKNIEAWQAVGRFLSLNAQSPPWLYLYGVPGVGKTHLALAIGWCRLMLGYQVVFYQTEELLDALRAGYDNKQYDATMRAVRDCRLLVLDDIGGQKPTEWAVTKLDAILNSRYLEARETVFTSNYPPDFVDKERGHVIPERIADRCAEGLVVRLYGNSYRRKRAALKYTT